DNLVDPAMPDSSAGNRPGTVFDLGAGNRMGHAAFTDPDQGDFSLLSTSNGRSSGPFGHDYGATAPSGAWIAGEPPAITSSREAAVEVGGAGMLAYRYRINDGEWSETLPIGDPTEAFATLERRAILHLADLNDGDYVVSVIGQDFAGEWQDEEH